MTDLARRTIIDKVSETGAALAATSERLASRSRSLADAVADTVADTAAAPGAAADPSSAPPPLLAMVQAARDVDVLAEQALRLSVQLARESGHTWQEIGDLLGVSRQAAFQRFGKPIDARTGEPMDPAIRVADAGDRAVKILTDLIAHRYDEVFATFNNQVAAGLPVENMPDVLSGIAAMVGEFERVAGAPFVRQLGKLTIADVPLAFEAGDMKGRVVFDPDARVAGLFVLEPGAP